MAERDDYHALWNSVLEQAKKDKGEIEYRNWLANINWARSTETKITLEVPTVFIQDQVKPRYQEYLEGLFKDLSGKDLTIDFEVKPKTAAVPPEKPEQKEDGRAPKPAPRPEAKPKKDRHPRLNLDYSFDTYVVGEERLPANAALAVAKNPGTTNYNPLLIYGGTGLGKTHLMQAIGNYIYENSSHKVIYNTAEDFTNEFVDSLKERGEKGTAAFKAKYRNTDVLLIDDIHFFENKETTQEELFHTFNALHNAKKQMVFTCDRPISELKKFAERLKSRFEWGLNMAINPPNYETRLAILKKKCEIKNKIIPDDVLNLIARHISSNVRDLEGALNKLIAYVDLVGKPITLEVAQQQLRDAIAGPKQTNLPIDIIIKVVADYYSLSHIDIKGKKRSQNIVFPRQLAMYITREITEFSTTEIGQAFGGRDHSTVMHSCNRIEERNKTDPTMDQTIETLTRLIKENFAKS
ncbi:MAG: chromosomal replication initiator protein DnaA [Spirochaetaceae bacterium]|nr:chromosomal replication initiator protein DnaA [Spirochaetaceae bacterium]